ncbi:hypothetical protein DL765_002664 [Monosporascus sp. GIB2]|nr:hypothetical protein DL765_002664 [Monosporascus sp. GIB2]
MERLPWILLEEICEYLADAEPKRRSLFAFSLVSKLCYSAAERQRFRIVSITAGGRAKLLDDLGRWRNMFGPTQRASYVRRLVIAGCMPLEQDDADGSTAAGDTVAGADEAAADPADIETHGSREEDDDDLRDRFEAFGSDDTFQEVSRVRQSDFIRKLAQYERRIQNKAWMPLANFIQQLSGLFDLIYTSTDQVPTCLLSTLHQYHPNCRLYVRHFYLRSLVQSRAQLHDIDPDEFELVTSPCLYGIVAPYHGYDSNGKLCFSEEAVLQIVAGLAPRLAYVTMLASHPGDSMELRAAYRMSRPAWPGFRAGVANPSHEARSKRPVGRLLHLRLGGDFTTYPRTLEKLSARTDFSKLRGLEVRALSTSLAALRRLHDMALGGMLCSLDKLCLNASPSNLGELEDMDEATSHILSALHPLTELDLAGTIGERTFRALCDHHGHSIRKLRFVPDRPGLSWPQMQQLRHRCPGLRSATLLTQRTGSDRDEVNIYRTLGQFRHLERINLHFCCEPSPKSAGSRESALRAVFVNSAIDASLALSIFRTISESGGTQGATRTSPLRLLKLLDSLRSVDSVGPGFTGVLRWLHRRWICERSVRDDRPDEVRVREIDKAERLHSLKSDL